MKIKFTLVLFLLAHLSLNAQCFDNVYSGNFTHIAKANDGSLWGWGGNLNHTLGFVSTTADKNELTPIQIGTETDWNTISIGSGHTIALKNNGTLWTWGNNEKGQIGIGSTSATVSSPTQIGTDNNWESISAGGFSSYAIKTDGTLWAWGKNLQGQLGLGNNIDYYTPTQVGTATNWNIIEASGDHLFAIKDNGTLWTCGYNIEGVLGLNYSAYAEENTITQIGTDTDWGKISSNSYHALALKTNGTLWAWGFSLYGQLGITDTSDQLVPIQIGTDTDWNTIATGQQTSLATKNDQTLWFSGNNGYGNYGNGTGGFGDYIRAFTQSGTDTWLSLGSSLYSSIGIKTDGNVYTWGKNRYGTKGNGTIDPYFPENPYTGPENYTPSLVACPATLSVDDINFSNYEVSVFPNPTKGVIAIKTPNNLKVSSVIIYNLSGKQILKQSNNFDTIQLQNISNGVYIMEILIEGKSIYKKIIKD